MKSGKLRRRFEGNTVAMVKMSVFDNIKESLKKVILLEDKINRLNDDVKRLQDNSFNHEKRLTRIETMIEMSQSGGRGRDLLE